MERTVEVLLAQINEDNAAAGPKVFPVLLIVCDSARIPEGWT